MKLATVQILTGIVIFSLLMGLPSNVMASSDLDMEDLFEMDIEELLQIEITVVSKKAEPIIEAPSIVSVVERDEFITYGDRNLQQLLQRQPSVYTRGSFIYSDNLAGFRGDMTTHADVHTLLLFNGRPIRESGQGQNVNMYTTFPLAALGSVELVRGPGSVLYGSNAFTGVINLKSRPIPEHTEFTVSTMAGSFDHFDTTVSAGGRSGDLGVVADLQTITEQGYTYGLTDTFGVYDEDNKHHRSLAGTLHMDYKRFTFDLFGSDLDAFAMGVMPFWSNPQKDYRNKRLFANAGYSFDLNERTYIELNATYNHQKNSLGGPSTMRVVNNSSDLLGEITLFTSPVRDVNVVMGYLSEYRSNYDSESDEIQTIPSYNYTPQSAYAQADYKIDRTVKLIAGTQWNKSGQGSSDFTSRYGVILTPFDKWGVKLLRGEAFRAPLAMETDIYDQYVLVGNKDLNPEKITTYDAQLFYSHKKIYAAATYFHSIINDMIVIDTSNFPLSYMNKGQQKYDGIEFETKYLMTRHLSLLGSYMYQNNKSSLGATLPVTPSNMGKLGLSYTWSQGSTALSYVFYDAPYPSGSSTIVNPQPEEVHLLSLNVNLDTSKWMGQKKGRTFLTLRAENVLNDKVYVPAFGNTGPNSHPYGAGTSLYAGLTMKF
ncbi:MAG: TonB-dependent receptor [Sedimentisphaerales bacterium]|nr:TonB-dependent receptor [Sedimentisphaerales bacterium]